MINVTNYLVTYTFLIPYLWTFEPCVPDKNKEVNEISHKTCLLF